MFLVSKVSPFILCVLTVDFLYPACFCFLSFPSLCSIYYQFSLCLFSVFLFYVSPPSDLYLLSIHYQSVFHCLFMCFLSDYSLYSFNLPAHGLLSAFALHILYMLYLTFWLLSDLFLCFVFSFYFLNIFGVGSIFDHCLYFSVLHVFFSVVCFWFLLGLFIFICSMSDLFVCLFFIFL